jgi:hypothetical protein
METFLGPTLFDHSTYYHSRSGISFARYRAKGAEIVEGASRPCEQYESDLRQSPGKDNWQYVYTTVNYFLNHAVDMFVYDAEQQNRCLISHDLVSVVPFSFFKNPVQHELT